jgi:hypothetical protein
MAETYESWKTWASSTLQSAVAPIRVAAPSLTTTQGSTSMLGTAPEGAGYTSTGGRRTKKKARKH